MPRKTKKTKFSDLRQIGKGKYVCSCGGTFSRKIQLTRHVFRDNTHTCAAVVSSLPRSRRTDLSTVDLTRSDNDNTQDGKEKAQDGNDNTPGDKKKTQDDNKNTQGDKGKSQGGKGNAPGSDDKTKSQDDKEQNQDDRENNQDGSTTPHDGSRCPPSLASLSTLYEEYDYPESLDSDSDWFPFDSKADALIFLWDTPCLSTRLPTTRLTLLLQTLPILGVQGLTCSDGQSFRSKYDARLPLMKIHTVSVMKSTRHHRKGKTAIKKPSEQKGETTEKKANDSLRVQVPFFSPDEYIIRTMADPILSSTLRFGLEKVPSYQNINQFNQTPYAAEILRWSQLKSIDRIQESGQSSPIMVGHWYAVQFEGQKEESIALVERLFYKGGEINRNDEDSTNWWPLLHVEVRICTLQVNKRTQFQMQRRLLRTDEMHSLPADNLRDKLPIFRGGIREFSSMDDTSKKQYFAYLHQWDPVHIPAEPIFQYPEVIEKKAFFFLSWLVDSFKATKSGKQSVDGLYQSILNIDSKFHHAGEVYKTLSLIEAGVDIGEVMRAVTASSQLQTGFNTYFSSHDDITPVKGTLALAPADLHQLSAQCRHGGSMSDHNCPNCTVIKAERMCTETKVTDFGTTRTRSQTDAVIKLCLDWIEAETVRKTGKGQGPATKSAINDIRCEFAVKLQPSWYEGWDFDEHRQGFREGEHLFYYGIFREQLEWMTTQMDTKTRNIFIARIDSFAWPTGTPILSFDFNPSRGKKWGTDVSMAMYKQLCTAALFVLDGLVPSNHYKHFTEMWLWHLDVLDQHHSVDDIPELQAQGKKILAEGVKIMPAVYDRPNGHGVVELIIRTLPALVFIRLVASGDFERHHQLTKRTNASRWFIHNAMQSFNLLDTIRTLLHGTRWGPNREYIMGQALRTLKDPRHPNMPHKLITNITSFLQQPIPQQGQELYHYNDEWNVYGYETLPTSNQPYRAIPDSKLLEAVATELKHLEENIDLSRCTWRYPNRLRRWFVDSSHRIIHVGQTVEIYNDNATDVALIHRFIELRYQAQPSDPGRKKRRNRLSDAANPAVQSKSAEWRIVFAQVRWYHDHQVEKKQSHTVRHSRIMSLDTDIAPDIFAIGLIKQQVLPVHFCCFDMLPYRRSMNCCTSTQEQSCHVVATCQSHGRIECSNYTCADRNNWIRRVEHNLSHRHYEIAGETQGLYLDAPKDFKYFDFGNVHSHSDDY